jgi:Predicted secreted Zn-dependent protease
MRGLLLLSLLAGCASTPRNPVLDRYPPGVLGRTTVTYYDIQGRTLAELSAEMRRLGPKVDGTSYVGETRSPMRWSWRTESTAGSTCTIRNIVVSVNAQILLPRWTPPAGVDSALVTEWRRFIAALETHEAGHKDITARAGSTIEEQLRGLSGSCTMISARATDIARVIADQEAGEQRRYDAETRHGLTQGTTFGTSLGVASTLDPSVPLTLLARSRIGTVRGSLAAPVERVWAAIPAAYAAAGLTINATDSSQHAAGDSLHARGQVGTLAVSDVVDCGAGQSAWQADSVDVAFFATSRLGPGEPSGTMVTTTVQAVAHPDHDKPVVCRSRGVLERLLFAAIRLQLAR